MRKDYSSRLRGIVATAVLGGAFMLEGCRYPAINNDVREEYPVIGQLFENIKDVRPIDPINQDTIWLTEEANRRARELKEEETRNIEY